VAKEYPETLLEFERWFRTEQACRDYLARLRWAKGFRCPRCEHKQAWKGGRRLWRCGKCRADTSVTAGTIFHRSHLPLRVWFRAIWWITSQKSGVSALGLQRMLGLGSYETAWACLHKLRRAMVRPGRESLTGKVEVDEIAVGGKQHGDRARAWRGGSKAIVVAAAEVRGEGTGRIRLKQIPDTSGDTLTGFIKNTVAPGSEIITDGWRSYNGLAELGYGHFPTTLMNKGRAASSAALPRVHRIAALLKRWLLGIHQGRVSRKHLGYYLDEFTFRFNRRLSAHRGMLFYRLLQQAVVVDPALGLTGRVK
jgi:transposase-like protein